MLKYQEQLADEYKYKPIPRTFFKDVRAEFEETLPEWCNMSGDTTKLETRSGTVIASGYNRIVIGDYGAFVEFSRAQANARHLKIKEGQSYRIEDPRYAEHVKYLWLTADDNSDVKVYDQKRSVEYADYKPGMLYVSVYEVFPAETDAGLSRRALCFRQQANQAYTVGAFSWEGLTIGAGRFHCRPVREKWRCGFHGRFG